MTDPNVPEYDASSWSYMANACSRKLKGILDSNLSSELPKGLYHDLNNFLVDAKRGSEFKDRHMPNHVKIAVAYRVLVESLPEEVRNTGVVERIDRYQFFLSSLRSPRELRQEEREVAKELRGLLDKIHQRSESYYSKMMRRGHVHMDNLSRRSAKI